MERKEMEERFLQLTRHLSEETLYNLLELLYRILLNESILNLEKTLT